eukprot:6966111-Prymnesium_polylepis.1
MAPSPLAPPASPPSPPPHVLVGLLAGNKTEGNWTLQTATSNIEVLHDAPYLCSFGGEHSLHRGDWAVWVALSQGSCAGAASSDS